MKAAFEDIPYYCFVRIFNAGGRGQSKTFREMLSRNP
jgi:hypothetical protein